MKKFLNRSFAIAMTLVIVITMAYGINLQTYAQSVDYVYAEGKYIKNWGIREQIATFLSPKAEEFYQKNQTSYAELITFLGSSNINKLPTSELYIQLHNLMEKNHTLITDYGYTRYKYQYTDIQNSGKDSNTISSFYSGDPIGPTWDYGETWNREHVWPNSKGDKAGEGENDIMMLRPTAADENGARSNRAYGKSSGYYNPNMESGGKHDLRGDVARIILYQYVRWNCTNTGSEYNPIGIFGTKGVIESREVLLEWIEDDPVDTWELGRNDSVQSITGTRNVFVDYPELAFILFGEQVPSGYATPSSNVESGVKPNPTPAPTPENDGKNDNQIKPTACTHAKAQTVAAEDPRCDIEGYTEGKYCPDCKKYISGRELIEAMGHTYDGDCDTTCNVCSYTREISVDVVHSFADDDICTVCGIENPDKQVQEETEINTDAQQSKGIDFVWIIIILGIVVVGVGVTLIIIYREKIWPKEID